MTYMLRIDRDHAASRTMLLAAGLLFSSAASASPRGEAYCMDERVQHAAGSALTDWAQNYPFAKVIIGREGADGQISSPQVAVETRDFVVCRGAYALVKAGPYGKAYVLGIPAFFYRVTPNPDGFAVTLEDFPDHIEGTPVTSRELLARFTIDGRPYLDVLADNQRRLHRTKRILRSSPISD